MCWLKNIGANYTNITTKIKAQILIITKRFDVFNVKKSYIFYGFFELLVEYL